jgi:hypothetical protein
LTRKLSVSSERFSCAVRCYRSTSDRYNKKHFSFLEPELVMSTETVISSELLISLSIYIAVFESGIG